MKTQKERKPLLALSASFVMPGLGQVYNGDLTKGFSIFLKFAFMMPVFSWLALHAPEKLLAPIVFFGVFLALGLVAYSAVDAYQTASRIGSTYQAAEFNRPYAYMAILFFGYFFVLNQLNTFTRTWLLEAYSSPSDSMTPNLLKGDSFFVDKRVNYPGAKSAIERGDASIFIYPNNRTRYYVKRVIGLPGDQIEIRDTDVLVNGKSIRGEEVHDLGSPELNRLLETHIAYRESGDRGTYIALWKKDAKHESATYTVPSGQVFVLGDNRDNAKDSRVFGTLPLTDVTAKAKQVWFSKGSDVGVRWNRLGTVLDVNPT